jgi:hypothetical protein
MRDRSLGFVLGGGVVAAGVLLWRRSRTTAASERLVLPPLVGWTVPVPTLSDRPVVVSNEFHRGTKAGDPREHLGVDLMFRRRDARGLIAAYPPKTTNGTPMFFMPEGVSALAAADGKVTFADMTGMGNSVIIQHPSGWATYYTHLFALAVKRGELVRASQPLGTIGASPTDSEHLKHLHFELWSGAKRSGAVDPAPYLASWTRVTSPWSPSTTPQVARNSCSVPARIDRARNGGTSAYRILGDRGEPYPEWVRALKGKAGVYIIRDADTHECLYVGSSAGRLYDTLTRHFQTVRHEAKEIPMT